MCGIAGIFSKDCNIDRRWIRNMNYILRHRGPDGEGFLALDSEYKVFQLGSRETMISLPSVDDFIGKTKLFLGHRRLSIIDPTPAGHQPMANDDKTLWIVFNGEIYNYIELRDELKNLGYRFNTSCDTEVIIKAYEAWGEKCLDRFNGMWALVILDLKKKILFGARDRFGVKPFYYIKREGFFAFASEAKALLHLPFYKKEINEGVVFDYLILGRDDLDEESFFKGIFELPPSYCFTLNLRDGEFSKNRYYFLSVNLEWEDFDEVKARKHSDKVKELIFKAVSLRLRSDVSVGSCLSGGVDSSTIVCVINELLKKENIPSIGEIQKVFTACYENEEIDESRWAKIVVDATKTEWHKTYPVDDQLFSDLEDLIYYQDFPFITTSMYAQYRVFKLAKENNIKVMLDGQGGDEVFSGYSGYYKAFWVEMLRNSRIKSLILESINLSNAPIKRNYLIKKILTHYVAAFVPTEVKKTLKYKSIFFNSDFFNRHKGRIDKLIDEDMFKSLNTMLHTFMTGFNLKPLLRYEDRNSMRFSIEARTPFADDIDLIEYVFSIPSSYKIHKGWSKYLLRESMVGIVPNEIRKRVDKIGFATPEENWFHNKKDLVKEVLNKDFIKHYINTDVLTIEKLMKKKPSIPISCWKLINLAIWEDIFKV